MQKMKGVLRGFGSFMAPQRDPISIVFIYSQLSPETFDPRKVVANFLEANFEYFRLSTARDDKND